MGGHAAANGATAPRTVSSWQPGGGGNGGTRAALAAAVAGAQAAVRDLGAGGAGGAGELRLLGLASELKSLVETGQESLDVQDIEALVRVCVGVVDARASGRARFLQIRYSALLLESLRRHGEALASRQLRLAWRPLFAAVCAAALAPMSESEGALLRSQYATQLSSVVRLARRHFAPGAADEIAAELLPRVAAGAGRRSALEAMTLFGLFMPSRGEGAVSDSWDGHIREWVRLWAEGDGIAAWDLTAVALLGRLAKSGALRMRGGYPVISDDVWASVVPLVAKASLRALRLPIGGASGSGVGGRRDGRGASALLATKGSVQGHAAKLLVYTLGRAGQAPEGAAHAAQALVVADAGTDAAAQVQAQPLQACCEALEQTCMLVALVEQYAHPSNGGSWSSALGRLLEDLSSHLHGRRELEASFGAHASEPAEAPIVLPGRLERAMTYTLLELASRAMYSKSLSLRSASTMAVVRAAAVLPERALPLVVERFDGALVSQTSPHQLTTSIRLMAYCARPLMLAEAPLVIDGGVTVSGPEALAAAMSAVLPGLDANDSGKTLNSIQLICAGLSATPPASAAAEPDRNAATALPLPWESWSEELLTRVLALLSHVDEGRGPPGREGESESGALDDPGSFLMAERSMFRPMLELFFSRVPEGCKERALGRLARWLQGKDISGITLEVGSLVGAAVYLDAAKAVPALVEPMLTTAMQELAEAADEAAQGASAAPSSSHAVKSAAEMEAIGLAVSFSGADLVPLGGRLLECIKLGFSSPSTAISTATARMCVSVISALVGVYPADEYRDTSAVADQTGNVFLRADEAALRASAPTWHAPGEGEQALVAHFIAELLEKPLATLRAFATSERAATKDTCRAALRSVSSVMRGLRGALPDFVPIGLPESRAVPRAPVVQTAMVGSAALRSEVARTLHEACGFVTANFGDDTTALRLLCGAMSVCVNVGACEHADYNSCHSGWKQHDAAMFAPDAACPGGFAGELGAPRPSWLVTEAAYLAYVFRSSQAPYRAFSGVDAPPPPPEALVLAADLTWLSMHTYRAVRKAALGGLEHTLRRLPQAIDPTVTTVLNRLVDTAVPKDAREGVVSGATVVLTFRTVGRWLCAPGNDAVLERVMSALCFSTGHHEEPATQGAIHKTLVVSLIMRLPSRFPDDMCVVPGNRADNDGDAAGAGAGAGHAVGVPSSDSDGSSGKWVLPTEPEDSASVEQATSDLRTKAATFEWSTTTCAAFAGALLGAPASADVEAGSGKGDGSIDSAPGGVAPLHWRYGQLVQTFLQARAEAGDAEALATVSLLSYVSDAAGQQMRPLGAAGLVLTLQRPSGIAFAPDELALATARAEGAARAIRGLLRRSKGGLARALVGGALLEATAGEVAGKGNSLLEASSEVSLLARGLAGAGLTPVDEMSTAVGSVYGRPATYPGAGLDASLAAMIGYAGGVGCLGAFVAPLREALAASAEEPGAVGAISAMFQGVLRAACRLAGEVQGSETGAAAFAAAMETVGTLGRLLREAALRGVGGAASAGEWATCVRHVMSQWKEASAPGSEVALASLLDLLVEPLPNSAPAASQARRLVVLAMALAELDGASWAVDWKLRLLAELQARAIEPGPHAVREATGKCLATLCCDALAARSTALGVGEDAMRLREACAVALATLTDTTVQLAVEVSAFGSHTGASSGEKDDGAAPGGPEGDATCPSVLPHGQLSDAQRRTLARVEVVLHAVLASCLNGDAAAMAPLVVAACRFLPLVVAAPDEDFKLLAARAASVLKHVALPPGALRDAARALAAAVVDSASWRARATALALAQQLAFRNAPVLGAVAVEELRVAVSTACADERAEVRELASATLSGVLRVGGAASLERERAEAEAAVRAGTLTLRTARRKAAAAAGSARRSAVTVGATSARHGDLLRLAACLQSRPYDLDSWMEPTLMALSDAACEPPPLRDTVKRAFQEFRRTHQDTWEAHVVPALSAEALEVINECARGQGASSHMFV